MTNEEVLVALAPLVGGPFTDDTRARIKQLTGRERIAGPNDIVTAVWDETRIRVELDDDGRICGFRFG